MNEFEKEVLLDKKHTKLMVIFCSFLSITILIIFFGFHIFFNTNKEAIKGCLKISNASAILNNEGYVIDCKIIK